MSISKSVASGPAGPKLAKDTADSVLRLTRSAESNLAQSEEEANDGT